MTRKEPPLKRFPLLTKRTVFDLSVLLFSLVGAFLISYLLEGQTGSEDHAGALFILAVLIISLNTSHYFYGILASVSSMILVNFAFKEPFFAFDFTTAENLTSAAAMLAVTCITSGLVKKLQDQERIKTEIEKERMRANLLRAISHDLRTPLTGIYGGISAVLDNEESFTSEKKQELLKKAKEDSAWLIRMVENLLSVTRIDGDRVKLGTDEVVLEELIDVVVQKLRGRYPSAPLTLSLPDDFVSVSGDAILLEQVLMNLLENAVLHAEGMTSLTLSVTLEEDARVRFSVRDNGCGLPPARQGLLEVIGGRTGRRSEEDEAPADGKRGSMGIGLSVCETIVKAHGSALVHTVPEGGGCEFSFTLQGETEDE